MLTFTTRTTPSAACSTPTRSDAASRAKLYTQAQKILQDDSPNLFTYAIQDIYAINNRIEWTPRTDEMIWHKEMSLAQK